MKNFIRATSWLILAAHLATPPALLLAWRSRVQAGDGAPGTLSEQQGGGIAFTARVETVPVQEAGISTGTAGASYFDPRADRDPTMSPWDYRRIKDEKEHIRAEYLERGLVRKFTERL